MLNLSIAKFCLQKNYTEYIILYNSSSGFMAYLMSCCKVEYLSMGSNNCSIFTVDMMIIWPEGRYLHNEIQIEMLELLSDIVVLWLKLVRVLLWILNPKSSVRFLRKWNFAPGILPHRYLEVNFNFRFFLLNNFFDLRPFWYTKLEF